jgi:putative serine protease PepD
MAFVIASVVLAAAPSSASFMDVQRTAAAPRRTPLAPAALSRKASPSIVTITTPEGQGSGVVVDPSGVIVTNLHVLRGQTQASVKLANGDIYDDVSVIDVDARKDLLIVKIKAVDLTPAAIGNSDLVTIGDRVVLIGSPRGLDRTVSDGLISAIRDSGEGYRVLQTSAAASRQQRRRDVQRIRRAHRDRHGEKTNGENLNFGIPVNYVRGLLSTQVR